MVKQVESLRSRGVVCAIMSSHEGISKQLLVGQYSLFCAPEAGLLVDRWRQLISESQLQSVLADEAFEIIYSH